jgi:pimeloyl-ACP methyl ester carboxylesterase
MIATTSYRRNGMIVADAIADLDALRSYVASAHGEPERVLIEGDSLGGLIATIIAERDKGAYDGAVVFDATLYLRDPTSQVGLTLMPRIPLLFVATARESAQAKSYITSLVARPAPVIQPVLFLISRVGHTNINQAERLEAVQAMNLWLDNGREALPRPRDQAPYFDATLPADPGPSTAEVSADAHTIETRVAEIDPVYGSVLLEAQPEDFAAAGIRPMSFCTLSARGKRFRILFGQSYGDVKDGQWIVFPDADGRTLVSQGHTSAAATSGLLVGDPVTLKLVMPGDPPSG